MVILPSCALRALLIACPSVGKSEREMHDEPRPFLTALKSIKFLARRLQNEVFSVYCTYPICGMYLRTSYTIMINLVESQ